jgi:hypothetical protein
MVRVYVGLWYDKFLKSKQTKMSKTRSFDVVAANKSSKNLYCETSALVRE